jgi:transcription initiation factor IIF auxiliary subunit
MIESVDISIRDSLFDPSSDPASTERVVTVRKGDRPLYKVWIYLDGRDLPYFDRVTYQLHPTFPNPVHTVRRTISNPRCQIVIWTWGIFTVRGTVYDKQGRTYTLSHRLEYSRQLQQDDLRYEYV